MSPNEDLLFVGFNQDHGCFACGTKFGFIVYNSYPLKVSYNDVIIITSLLLRNSCFAILITLFLRYSYLYYVIPLKVKQRRVVPGITCGCSKVEMLYRCNFLALTGNENCSHLPSTKVWLISLFELHGHLETLGRNMGLWNTKVRCWFEFFFGSEASSIDQRYDYYWIRQNDKSFLIHPTAITN